MSSPAAADFIVSGRVQGVGFRPFVYRLAQRFELTGWVQNRQGWVEIHAEGTAPQLERFARALQDEAPPLAQPSVRRQPAEPLGAADFAIRSSVQDAAADIHLPPDYFACPDCLAELFDPHNRRYRYPFINCTQCGPRYTLIERLPYDRAATSMKTFALCPDCRAEYENPLDRRFHAEPVACPRCGPQLFYRDAGAPAGCAGEQALAAAVATLRAGRIVAVKGVGGYHLLCDARSAAAVARLRQRKARPDKPFAVMFANLEAVGHVVELDKAEADFLASPLRPILLLRLRQQADLPPGLAPGLNELGVMLPYSPLHHLLLADFAGPLVATSANISGEPVLTAAAEAEIRLAAVADGFLHHDRGIVRPADDPVYRWIAGAPRPLRLGRGNAPLELDLPFTLREPLLAVGAHNKNTVALAWGRRVVVSPHIGDLGSQRAQQVFEQVLDDLQQLYQVRPGRVVCDAHPAYASSRWAHASGLAVSTVWHHHAHASALAGEYPDSGNWLVFTWDGVGLGPDGTLWGGEALYGRPGRWQRQASLRPFRLPGGEAAGRQPWRSAAALAWECDSRWPEVPDASGMLRQAWQQGLNAPLSSAAGRLFDAAAAFAGLVRETTYEGQGPMQLEAACSGAAKATPLPLARDTEGVWRSDWAPLLPLLQDPAASIAARAEMLHASLAQALVDQLQAVRAERPVDCVGLSGGVFQNRRLTELVVQLLQQTGLPVRLARQVPANDAGISFGQIIEAGAILHE